MKLGKKILVLSAFLVILLFIGFLVPGREQAQNTEPLVFSDGDIRVYSPISGQRITRPLVIVGEARVFENTFLFALKDEYGNLLANGYSSTNASDIGQFGPFVVSLWYDERADNTLATVEVYNQSARDGSVENLVSIPVLLSSEEQMSLKVFFGNSKSDPTAQNCGMTYPVVRVVPKTQAVARGALNLLFAGPSEVEQSLGYFTSLDNPEVRILDLVIEDGVAKVNFNEALNQIGGSCKVMATRAQIEKTLKQFETVKEVEISVNGRSDEVLQP
ncbi:MAG: hypothetical protein COU10_01260 [Candidatus Harrisonbacteria bacterium CG10_big_fil_rev_8_21_14_0_10_45_28]|uniref:GerMN domain-containing protein n=1 Tax=Candidatus Harrisonbacteria bacterium CG10_big_fil_rev_8_21_14_0_10_45_28 TaxID=1974586 RepID=A0A2H0UNQ4_9BACT|nr:MAG: hypothetical protein COU10_01260 [Candidatus Harrisonbacteria bacterium CG10_big_fil_rev_8_21_14_0_10_45_28]